jgi:hypothetical protein
MKLAMITLILFPILGQAEVSDFNSLIDENAKVQRELQTTIQDKTGNSAKALKPTDNKVVVVETESYNVPTSGRTLKFKKELHQYQPPQQNEIKRIAEELKAADREF